MRPGSGPDGWGVDWGTADVTRLDISRDATLQKRFWWEYETHLFLSYPSKKQCPFDP